MTIFTQRKKIYVPHITYEMPYLREYSLWIVHFEICLKTSKRPFTQRDIFGWYSTIPMNWSLFVEQN